MTIEIGTMFIKQRGKRTNKERVETVTDRDVCLVTIVKGLIL